MKTLFLSIIIASIVIATVASISLFFNPGHQNPCTYCPEQPSPISVQNIPTVIIPKDSEDQNSDKNYDPQYIRVIIGVNNTVRWINQGDVMNSVVADNQSDTDFYNATNSFSTVTGFSNVTRVSTFSNFMLPGQSFEYTFTKPGFFGYHGVPHPWQRGWILVLTSDQLNIQIPESVSSIGTINFNDTYVVGQKIDFGIYISGYGSTCPIPDISIQKQDGTPVWYANHIVTLCDPERGIFNKQYRLSDGFGTPVINETGYYVMIVSYKDQIMKLPFIVIQNRVNVTNTNFSIYYTITGENKIIDANLDNMSQTLTFSVESSHNGTLTITIPRALLDAKMHNQDDQFIILADGQEIQYKEIHKTVIDRTLSIPFQQGINKIEIIATTPI